MRSGEKLARVGKMAELFDDHSPLQLMASGTWNKKSFTLIGRLQYKYGEGTWTEWVAILPDGSNAFLSEDNGAYVFTVPQAIQRAMPNASAFKVGGTTTLNGKSFSVASNATVSLLSAQGELPHLPALGTPFSMVELRSADGEVLSIDYGTQPPQLAMGRSVQLEDLKLSGLKDESAKDEKGRQFACPNCGAQVEVTLAQSKSVTCRSCSSLIDLSQGIGAELKAAIQDEPVQPVIPLGTIGALQGTQWQVVGFQHRMGNEPSDPDEHFGWDEYLLFNQKRGFIFLVDSTEGWSVVKPTTGAPVMASNGQSATYLGTKYQLKETYNAETNYVAGEFYWQVARGQKTSNRDFVAGNNMLSLEQTPTEVTWSSGAKIASDEVAKAFKLEGKKDLLKRSDAKTISGIGCGTIIVILLIILVFLFVIGRCSSCDPKVENCSSSSSSRSSGGSFGGSSSGGGHK